MCDGMKRNAALHDQESFPAGEQILHVLHVVIRVISPLFAAICKKIIMQVACIHACTCMFLKGVQKLRLEPASGWRCCFTPYGSL